MKSSFDKISFIYDFFEKHISKDYAVSISLIKEYLHVENYYKVIDVGGGTGFFAEFLSKEVNNVIVIDPSKKMLLKIKNFEINKIQADGKTIPFKNEIFDLAISINTLHHIDKKFQKQTLSQIYKILKNEGKLFIIDIYPKDKGLMKIIISIFSKFEEFLTGKIYHISPDDLKLKLKDTGFKEILIYSFNENYRYVICCKK